MPLTARRSASWRPVAPADQWAAGPAAGVGQTIDRHHVYRLVARIAKAAGIPKHISPHSLRHAAITNTLDAGDPLWRRRVGPTASRFGPARVGHAGQQVISSVAGVRGIQGLRWGCRCGSGLPDATDRVGADPLRVGLGDSVATTIISFEAAPADADLASASSETVRPR